MSQKKISRKVWAQHQYMLKNLRQMARFLGIDKMGGVTVKMDQFQRLRQNFTICAERYQKASIRLNKTHDRVEKAKITYEVCDNKHQMQTCLKQMTTITMKLSQKHKREKGGKRPKKYEMAEQNEQEMDPLERQIEYKNLTIYHLQKSFFKLIKSERRMPTYKQMQENQAMTMSELKQRARDRPLMEDDEEDLQERQILEALKHIDDMIEERLDKILDGIQLMNYNALSISEGINLVQKKIMVNMDKVTHNVQELKQNQKRIDEAAKYVSKPTCLVNVCILVLLGILGYLVVRLIWFSDVDSSDIIK